MSVRDVCVCVCYLKGPYILQFLFAFPVTVNQYHQEPMNIILVTSGYGVKSILREDGILGYPLFPEVFNLQTVAISKQPQQQPHVTYMCTHVCDLKSEDSLETNLWETNVVVLSNRCSTHLQC